MQPFLRKIFEGINALEFQVRTANACRGLCMTIARSRRLIGVTVGSRALAQCSHLINATGAIPYFSSPCPCSHSSHTPPRQRPLAGYTRAVCPLPQHPHFPSPLLPSSSTLQPEGQVSAMYSEEGEKVTFKDRFNPQDSQGNVERWLIECEIAMRSTLKDTIRRAHNDYAKNLRINWVTSWPGQVVICVDCMYWTKEVAEAISKATLVDYAQQCTDELMKVREWCCGGQGRGSVLGRPHSPALSRATPSRTLNCLLLASPHHRGARVFVEWQGATICKCQDEAARELRVCGGG